MRTFIKKTFYLLLLSTLLFCILCYPKLAVSFAANGLRLWFQTMIPTLLPFMILSSILIKLSLHRLLVHLLTPLFHKLFQVGSDGIYGICMGFLFGFPMGAKITAELYQQHFITRREASYLLSFCNNISPVYFINVVLSGFSIKKWLPFFFGMYGIPFCYGILLRHTLYRTLPVIPANAVSETVKHVTFFTILDDSITSALRAITQLGGYMVFFQVCSCIPYLVCQKIPFLFCLSSCLLEITGGIQQTMQSSLPSLTQMLLIFPALLFSGLSCFAQAASMIRDTDLSIFPYFLHKCIQTSIGILYYYVIFF